MNNDKYLIKDNELENVNGGVMPIIYDGITKVPTVDPIPLVPETKKVEMGNHEFEYGTDLIKKLLK